MSEDVFNNNVEMAIQSIPIDQLQPNSYNPNKMTDDEFQELVAEVRHLGRVPKPVVVRPVENGFEIVDGEHSWRAAREVGLGEVLCEIVQVDAYEGMRQTINRNCGGTNNPLLLGQAFQQMKQLRGFSNRELAEDINKTEGTVRNALLFVEVLELRNGYAPGGDHTATVSRLSIEQVRRFLKLPSLIANKWMDAGGQLNLLGGEVDFETLEFLAQWLCRTGLDRTVKGTADAFASSLLRAAKLCQWLLIHKAIPHIDDYINPVADSNLPCDVLDYLLFVKTGDDEQPAIPLDVWIEIVRRAAATTFDLGYKLLEQVNTEVIAAVRQVGIDPSTLQRSEASQMPALLQWGGISSSWCGPGPFGS